MSYVVNGEELETGEEDFLLEANFSDDVPPVIAAAEKITLTDDHWTVINYLRDKYKEDGQTRTSVTCCQKWKTCTRAPTGRKSCTSCSPTCRLVRVHALPACPSLSARAATDPGSERPLSGQRGERHAARFHLAVHLPRLDPWFSNTLVTTEDLAAHLDDPNWIVSRLPLHPDRPGKPAARPTPRPTSPGHVYVHLDDDLAAPMGETTGRHRCPIRGR